MSRLNLTRIKHLRWWIYTAKDNGLADRGAIVRLGRAVWIDEDRFDEWLNSHRSREG